jgi:predicted ester cyclase
MFRNAFPDFRAVIHDLIAEDDKVVTRKTFDGTHEGELLGIPPTGKEVTIELIDILRVADGEITDHWNVVDQLGLMQQLGVILK